MAVLQAQTASDQFMSIAESVERHAGERGGDVAFRFVGRHAAHTRELTWLELDQRARGVAAVLGNNGLSGEPVAIVCPDPLDFVVALCGCFYAGAVAVPVPAVATRRSAGRIGAILSAASPGAVLAPGAMLDQPWLSELLVAEGVKGLPLDTPTDGTGTTARRAADPDATALLQFTSGSTGAPRGVVLSHANIAANCSAIVEAFGLGQQTRGFSWLPLHHDMGLVGHVLTPFWVGGRQTIMDPLLFLHSPLRWLQRVGEEAASITSAPNFAYDLCVKEAEKADLTGLDLSSVTTAVCGGEPVWPETMERFCAAFAPAGFNRRAFAPSYGLAEATLLVSSGKRPGGPKVFAGTVTDNRSTEAGTVDVRTVTLGRPVSSVQVRILDEGGAECAEGEIGEIEISGGSVGRMVTEGGTIDTSGKVMTGDLGFISGGEVHINGRIKDLIILRGQNVYPSDIESAAVRADPAVRAGAVAAVAIQDDGTEAILLMFEADRTLPIAEQFTGICRRLNEAVARATGQTPSAIVAVPSGALARTTSGKIRRNAVAEAYMSGTLPITASSAEVPAPQEPTH